MTRIRFIKIGMVALCLAVGCGFLLPVFTAVRITAPMLSMPILITRNGQEVPASQIRSVQYLFGVNPPKAPQEVSGGVLREANESDGYYLIGAPFTIYRSGVIFTSTVVKPEIRSVFLRVTFTDGNTVSMSFPVLSDRRENVPMFVDLGDGHH